LNGGRDFYAARNCLRCELGLQALQHFPQQAVDIDGAMVRWERIGAELAASGAMEN
jgi:hypothetical protein